MANCRNCGAPLEQDALFCNACGARNDPMPEQNAPPQQPVYGAPTQDGYPQQPYSAPYQPAPQQPAGYPPQGQPPQGQPAAYPQQPYQQPAPAAQPQAYPTPVQGGGAPPQQPPYPPQGQPPYGGPYGYGGGQPPKKKRTGLIIAIIAASVAVVILAALLLYVFVLGGGNGSSSLGVYSSSSISSSSAGSSSLPAGSSSVSDSASSIPGDPLNPADLPYQMGDAPAFDFDWMEPVVVSTPWYAPWHFLNVYKDGQTGVVNFEDASWVFPLHSGSPILFCQYDYVHSLPPSIAALSTDAQRNQAMAAAGFPFETHGDHGGGGTAVYARSSSGGMTLGWLEYGEFMADTINKDHIDPVIPVIDLSTYQNNLKFGLATKDGQLVLPIEFDSVSRVISNAVALEKNGKYGYFSVESMVQITECIYGPVFTQNPYYGPSPGFFQAGLCPVELNGLYGVIDIGGGMPVPPMFDGITNVITQWAWVKMEGQWHQIYIK